MRNTFVMTRAVPMLLASLALFASLAAPVSAQTCAGNSTQATCACPTSGGGTTCFGGQLYRSTDGSCQNDTRPCAGNQVFSCSATACQCDTASFPCGGCTAATSTVGAACGSPAGGAYTNQCGACACPSGKTLCAASSTCVLNLACPTGTTFDPCTNSCTTPYVLLSPSSTQTGGINISGDVNSTNGDFYLANGKALRVDGSGATTLNVGNWGSGATGLTVNFPATTQLCFGGTDCRTSWPAAADFNGTYLNTTGGDTMTGDLRLSGATSDLHVDGRIGIGTTSPGTKLTVVTTTANDSIRLTGSGSLFSGLFTNLGAGAFNPITAAGDNGIFYGSTGVDAGTGGFVLAPWRSAASGLRMDSTGAISMSTSGAGPTLNVTGTTETDSLRVTTGAGAGLVLTSDASGNATWQASPGISGSGTTNYVPKFTAASSVGNSPIYINPSNSQVGIGLTATNANLHISVDDTSIANQYLMVENRNSGAVTQQFRSAPTNNSYSIGINTGHSGNFEISNSGALSTNTRFAINTAGNVGIGTYTPANKLDVNGTVGATRLIVNGSSTNTITSSNGQALAVSDTAPTNTGGWGLNVTSTAQTGIVGSGAVYGVMGVGTGSGTGMIGLVGSGGTGDGVRAETQSDSGRALFVNANSTTRTAVYSGTGLNYFGGNVGIGMTADATYRLSVAGSYALRTGSPSGSYMDVFNGGNTSISLGLGGTDAGFVEARKNASNENVINIAACTTAGSCPQYLSLNQSGNVGIGTDDAYYDLDVQGVFRATGTGAFGGQSPNNSFGMSASSPSIGAYFTNTNYGSTSYPAYYDYGIYAAGPGMGGYFYDTNNYTTALLASGTYSFSGGGTMRNDGDFEMYNKTALRGSDSWLRLNQDSEFSSGTHTPSNFNASGITVGALYYNPGAGNLEVQGTITSNYYSSYWYADAWNGYVTPWNYTNEPESNKMCVLVESIYEDNGGHCQNYTSGGYWYSRGISYASPSHVYCVWRCYKFR